MAVIYPHLLHSILQVHQNLLGDIPYPFFDPACLRYEALRSVAIEHTELKPALQHYGLTEYAYRKSLAAFQQHGVAGLIGLESVKLVEQLPVEAERMVFVLKQARPWIPATKMSLILKGFGYEVSVSLMRHLYASYGWAGGTRQYTEVDFWALNMKVMRLTELHGQSIPRAGFIEQTDRLQVLLEVFRTLGSKGITKRYPGSRVSLAAHKREFLSLGVLGLVERAEVPFRNSKVGFRDEGWMILSKVQDQKKGPSYYAKILESKGISVDQTCVTKIFTRWKVKDFQSKFVGDIRLLEAEGVESQEPMRIAVPRRGALRMDRGFIGLLQSLEHQSVALAHPGVLLFLPYVKRLKIYEKAASLLEVDPDRGYSWFSLLLVNLGRILAGISSVSKACRSDEPSVPLMGGLVGMPSKDSVLNGLAEIGEGELLSLRRYLTAIAAEQGLIEGKRIVFDFHARDFTGYDVELKNIGKAPSSKRKICFPGFRPHIAWDAVTGMPISLEFRNGSARATTTIKRFIRELLGGVLEETAVEHVYLDSEYTGESIWKYIVESENGLGAELTMCIKRNKRVKKYVEEFLKSNPRWLFYDEEHTYSEGVFSIPIGDSGRDLSCVLKRKEATGALRCFGSTLVGLSSREILQEYRSRWTIENGIKDLVANYFFDDIPGIDPHRINIHYFVVTLARTVYEMFCKDYQDAVNPDGSKRGIATVRPEFLTGSNARVSRLKDELVLQWVDPYPQKKHDCIESLFKKLNEEMQEGLPFLGGMKPRFEIGPPRPEALRNRFRREPLEF